VLFLVHGAKSDWHPFGTILAMDRADLWTVCRQPVGDPSTRGAKWEDRTTEYPEWEAEYLIVEQDGVAIVGEIRIVPHVQYAPAPIGDTPETVTGWTEQRYPKGGITARLMHRVKVNSSIIAGAFKPLELGSTKFPRSIPSVFTEEGVSDGQKSRGHERSPLFLAEVAATYVALVEAQPTKVIPALVDALSERGIFYGITGVRELLNKARHNGLLTAAPRGRAGGKLTPKALALLGDDRSTNGTPPTGEGMEARRG
jgi:hypothetical protein